MVGRKPKPTALKELAGFPGHHPRNAREPKPEPYAPRCPEHLNAEARREWHRITPQLYKLGLLTNIDRAALAAYCVTYGRWVEAERIVADKGMIAKTETGRVIQNPYLVIANQALVEMRRYMTEFGMTPASRSRIMTAEKGEGEPNLADVLFGAEVSVG